MKLHKKLDSLKFDNERQINIQYRMEQETMWVRSLLKDDHHDICLDWQIDIPTHTVTDLEGRMDDIPFKDCSAALEILKQIKGLEIRVGVKKGFRTRFLKQGGCTHITELALATFDFIIARVYGPASGELTEEEKGKRRRQLASFLCDNNSCVIFNKENLPCFDEQGRYKDKEYHY
jgi:hypothetical protein